MHKLCALSDLHRRRDTIIKLSHALAAKRNKTSLAALRTLKRDRKYENIDSFDLRPPPGDTHTLSPSISPPLYLSLSEFPNKRSHKGGVCCFKRSTLHRFRKNIATPHPDSCSQTSSRPVTTAAKEQKQRSCSLRTHPSFRLIIPEAAFGTIFTPNRNESGPVFRVLRLLIGQSACFTRAHWPRGRACAASLRETAVFQRSALAGSVFCIPFLLSYPFQEASATVPPLQYNLQHHHVFNGCAHTLLAPSRRTKRERERASWKDNASTPPPSACSSSPLQVREKRNAA